MILSNPDTPSVRKEIERLSKNIKTDLDSLKSSSELMQFKASAFRTLYSSIYSTMTDACKQGMKDVEVVSAIPRLDLYAQKLADDTVSWIAANSAAALQIEAGKITKKNMASRARAKAIAEDNLYQSFYLGKRLGWGTDPKAYKSWYVHSSHDKDDTCDDNEEAGDLPINAVFPSGHYQPKAHIGCNCYLVLVRNKARKYLT